MLFRSSSGVCHGRCLSEAGTPTDRWSSVGCGVCCAFDLNGDGLLTLEEMLGFRKAMCGQDEEGMQTLLEELVVSFLLDLVTSLHFLADNIIRIQRKHSNENSDEILR